MNAIQALTVVVIRLWCASAIIRGLLTFPSAFLFTQQYSGQISTIYVAVTSTTWLAVGLFGWFVAPKLVLKLMEGPLDQSIRFQIDADLIVVCGCFLIGWFYLVQYASVLVSEMASVVFKVAYVDATSSSAMRAKPFNWLDLDGVFKSALVVAAAFWMAFRPQHVARLVSYLRNAGV